MGLVPLPLPEEEGRVEEEDQEGDGLSGAGCQGGLGCRGEA